MTIQQLETISALREQLALVRKAEKKIALIPTMGNLHTGHLSLVKRAQDIADYVVVTIFVNPTQFVAGEDFGSYPRTQSKDVILLDDLNVDTVFIPAISEIYNTDQIKTKVTVPELDSIYCGKFRPGHFEGVATITTKLFNIAQPDVALFGKKDYQQLLVIRSLVKNLDLPVKIIGSATIREEDGLAMSSRNKYLSNEERQRAPLLYKCIIDVAEAIKQGAKDYEKLENAAIMRLKKAGFQPEYLSICDAETLKPPDDQKIVVISAAWLGKARLIDNVVVQPYD